MRDFPRTSFLTFYPLTPQSPDTPVNHDGNWPPDKKPAPNGPQSQASFPLLQVIPTYILAFSSTRPRHGNYPSDRMPHMGCQNTPPHNPSDPKNPPITARRSIPPDCMDGKPHPPPYKSTQALKRGTTEFFQINNDSFPFLFVQNRSQISVHGAQSS